LQATGATRRKAHPIEPARQLVRLRSEFQRASRMISENGFEKRQQPRLVGVKPVISANYAGEGVSRSRD
jgi:hypothetical protein